MTQHLPTEVFSFFFFFVSFYTNCTFDLSKRVSMSVQEEGTPRISTAGDPDEGRYEDRDEDRDEDKDKARDGAPSEAGAEDTENATGKTKAESEEEVVVKFSMTDLFPDGCDRYNKDCCCCHCYAVKRALRHAAFLCSPEGKRRRQMKLQMKDFFMDINAITATHQRVNNMLNGTRQYPPPATRSFPISIVHVTPMTKDSMFIEWYQHDDAYVTHYEIYVDDSLVKRIFCPDITSTVVLDVNMKSTHHIRMKAVPRKGLGSKASRIDKLVRDVCCGKLSKVLEADYFCECAKKSQLDKAKEQYSSNSCQMLVDFWKDSEFIYVPLCRCKNDCMCECFGEEHNACS